MNGQASTQNDLKMSDVRFYNLLWSKGVHNTQGSLYYHLHLRTYKHLTVNSVA